MNARPVWIAALLLLPTFAHAKTAASDSKAIRIADQVMQSLGGRKHWDDLGGLRWSFEAAVHDTVRSSRRHAWDRKTGWYRVEGKNRAGQPFVFMKKLGTDEGHAWMNGNAIEGDSLKTLLKRAEAIWVNDSYWFLMPYKLRDPGVTLKYDGEVKSAGGTWDRIAMSFENVGLTPGDHYWVFVNRKNHRVEKWQMVLQGRQPPPDEYTWEGWEEHDGLWFPTAHKGADATTIFTRNVATSASIPATEFSAP
jgi:hypothetical protein